MLPPGSRANHQFQTIANLPSSSFLFRFQPYSLDSSLFSGISKSRGTMNSFEAFPYYFKSFRIMSFSALGPATPENQCHSFAQSPRRGKTSFSTLYPFYRPFFHHPMGSQSPCKTLTSTHHLLQFCDSFHKNVSLPLYTLCLFPSSSPLPRNYLHTFDLRRSGMITSRDRQPAENSNDITPRPVPIKRVKKSPQMLFRKGGRAQEGKGKDRALST